MHSEARPAVGQGHRVGLRSPASPAGGAIVLETLSAAPRIFRVHNFVGPAEVRRRHNPHRSL